MAITDCNDATVALQEHFQQLALHVRNVLRLIDNDPIVTPCAEIQGDGQVELIIEVDDGGVGDAALQDRVNPEQKLIDLDATTVDVETVHHHHPALASRDVRARCVDVHAVGHQTVGFRLGDQVGDLGLDLLCLVGQVLVDQDAGLVRVDGVEVEIETAA